MKNISILCLGTIKEAYFKQAFLEYEKRISRNIKLKIIELPAKGFSEKNTLMIKKQESQRVLNFLEKNKDSEVFLLSENGEELSSVQFSQKIFKINEPIIFVIAGTLGFDFEILKNYRKISLSKMTFLHEMARVILIEQIYRAVNIEKGKKYHY